MKTKFTTLTLLLLFVASFTYAQTSAEISDIAIQGIARDANNTAKANTAIKLTLEFYYMDGATSVDISSFTETVDTDAFGVFSYVVSPDYRDSPLFANHQVYLRISEGLNGENIISDEKLKHVPYAIAANNGVPTGSIMPFIGDTAPKGWVMCDGSDLPIDNSADALKELLGGPSVTKAPDLRSLFLRGIGTNSDAQFSANARGSALNTTQQDANLSHLHAVNITTSENGNHNHGIGNSDTSDDNTVRNAQYNVNSITRGENNFFTQPNGAHAHTVTGNTGAEGTESRPVNYGVNYIIKL